MLISDCEIRGGNIHINTSRDVVHPMKSFYGVTFRMAYPKVFFNNCVFNNPRGPPMEFQQDDIGTNQQHVALQIVDPAIPSVRQQRFLMSVDIPASYFTVRRHRIRPGNRRSDR